jgi:uncharacterized membrane protein
MEQVLALMIFLGGFTFITMGLCVANSIEAKESKRVAIIMTGITVLGALSLVVGLIGIIIYNL